MKAIVEYARRELEAKGWTVVNGRNTNHPDTCLEILHPINKRSLVTFDTFLRGKILVGSIVGSKVFHLDEPNSIDKAIIEMESYAHHGMVLLDHLMVCGYDVSGRTDNTVLDQQ